MLVLLHGKLRMASGNWLFDGCFFLGVARTSLLAWWDCREEWMSSNRRQSVPQSPHSEGDRGTSVSTGCRILRWLLACVTSPNLWKSAKPYLGLSHISIWRFLLPLPLTQWHRIDRWPLECLLTVLLSRFPLSRWCSNALWIGEASLSRTWFSGLLACVQGCSFPGRDTK